MMNTQELAEQAKTLAEGLVAGELFAEAQAAAEAALALQPNDRTTWILLAASLAKQGKHAPAIDAYQRALSLDDQDIMCLTSLGELLLEMGAYTQAAAALEKAMQLDPNAEHPFGCRARALVAKTLQKLK